MACAQCAGMPRLFTERLARRELRRYRRRGPRKTTRWLLDALGRPAFSGRVLLDIGGGIGSIQHEFVAEGGARVFGVDAAPAYIAAAREEATRRGYADRASYQQGDFVDAAPQVPRAHLVTLDRVVCCYPDPAALLRAAAERATEAVGLVWPRNRLLARIGFRALNAWLRLVRNPFRTFVHPDSLIDGALRAQGLRRRSHRTTLLWQVAVYERTAA